MTTPSAHHIDAAISIVDTDEFKALMAVHRIGKCVELVAAAMAEGEARETANLIGIIAGIREKSGVGGKPMLGELADAIASRIEEARREGMKRAADELEAVLEKRKAEKKKAGNDYIASSIGFIRHLVSISEAGEGGQ